MMMILLCFYSVENEFLKENFNSDSFCFVACQNLVYEDSFYIKLISLSCSSHDGAYVLTVTLFLVVLTSDRKFTPNYFSVK